MDLVIFLINQVKDYKLIPTNILYLTPIGIGCRINFSDVTTLTTERPFGREIQWSLREDFANVFSNQRENKHQG